MIRKIISSALAVSLVFGTAAVLPEGFSAKSAITARAEENEAKIIALNTTVSNTIEQLGGFDVAIQRYSFTLTNDGYVALNFVKGAETNSDKAWHVRVYDSSNNLILFREYAPGSSDDTPALGLAKGTYYIEVGPKYTYFVPTTKYSFTLNFTASNNCEKERNENVSKSTAAALDSWYYGALTGGNDDGDETDKDFFKYSIPSTDYYRLFFGKEFDESDLGRTVTFYNANGQEIESTNIFAGDIKTETYDIKLSKGTAYIGVTSKDGEQKPIATYKLKLIKTIPLTGGKLTLDKKTAVYTAKTIKPTTTLKLDGKTLKKGTDYSVSYKNCKSVGKATVTITGIGKYRGTLSADFTINPKASSVKKVTSPKTKQIKVTYKKVANVTGYQVTFATSKKFAKSKTKTATVKGAAKTSKVIKSLKKGKTYYVKVRTYKTVGGKKYYSAYSKVKSLKTK
ncbi:MAG: hypothetical protein IJ740_14420 [Ruminococcus sp.]|nr:hypothetical protein [Ruminococcus sp.]